MTELSITIHRMKISSLDHSMFAKPYWEFNNDYNDDTMVFALVYDGLTHLYDNLSDIIPVEIDDMGMKTFTLVFDDEWAIVSQDYRTRTKNVPANETMSLRDVILEVTN